MAQKNEIKSARNGGNGKPKRKLQLRFQVNFKNILAVALILLFLGPLLLSLGNVHPGQESVPLSAVLNDIKEGKVEKIKISDDRLTVGYKNGEEKFSTKELSESFTQVLKNSGIDPTSVSFKIEDKVLSRVWLDVLGIVLPVGLMVLFFLFIFRQARGAQDNLFSFGKSGARLFAKGKQNTTFKDVAGVDEAKKELEEIVDFLKNPGKYKAIGARTPKGVLLVGLAGVGKTLLARAVAGEAGVPFFSMAGSEFMEMLVGVGASVTGDTPILIKERQKTELLPIGQFVDKFYKSDEEGLVKVGDVQTLGFENEKASFWGYKNDRMPRIAGSSFKYVTAVFRHRVSEIYELHYLGGVIKTTADHSVFIRRSGRILPVATKDIKKGDLLVELPLNIRLAHKPGVSQRHKIIAHKFSAPVSIELDVWDDDQDLVEKYQFVLDNIGAMSQYAIAGQIGVSQATVGNWQNKTHMPQALSKKLVKLPLPDKVLVTLSLMKLFGFYTAEGRGTNNLEFTFSVQEDEIHKEVVELMREVFGIGMPVVEKTIDNTLRIKYYSAHLGRFFARHCGNGSHNKHVPDFIWDLSKVYFLAFLEGYSRGDGYQTKSGKLSVTSVSKRLILELSWLCSMHGIKVGIKHGQYQAGRIIKNKPLPEGEYWNLIIGKTANPFLFEKVGYPNQFKRAIVQKVVKKPYDGFVYDLCGVENEAFFGGEKPVLLHNSRVRDLFATAKKAAPAIIFIDEIDAIGRQRGFGLAGGHDEREQTLNQILVEMDGFTPNDNVVVLAATNRGDLLDPALLRPGRFDRRVILDMPDKEGRLAILKIHAQGKKFDKEINWERVASRTVGFSGADLENMLNEAAILAARDNKDIINMSDVEEAATKVKLGPAKKRIQTDEDKKITAYHEAGHALVTHTLPNMDPVHRISIVARGMSLGHTLIPPAADRSHETRTHLLEQITAMLGGRAAEDMVFGEMTTGAANDIERATGIARHMVSDFGMSGLGPVNWGPQYDDESRGRLWEPAQVSPRTQDRIDSEVRKIMEDCYAQAVRILKAGHKRLDRIAEALVQKETLERDDFETLVGPKPVIKLAFASVKD